MRPVRVGFSPTSSISTREPGSEAAATIQNAADEKSPGIVSDWAAPAGPPPTETVSPDRIDVDIRTSSAPARCDPGSAPAR